MAEFVWKNIRFVVKINHFDGSMVYKDAAHLGGQWSDAQRSIDNKSLDATFRRRLKAAMEDLASQRNTI